MTAQQNISELLEGIKQGDQIAESKFVKKYEGIIFTIAVRDISSIEDAKEITNDTLRICIYNIKKGKLREPEKIGNYILGICWRLCKKHHKRVKAIKRGVNAIHESLDNEYRKKNLEIKVSEASGEDDPLMILEKSERRKRIRDAVAKVKNNNYRKLLELILEDYSPKEIAKKINVDQNQIYSMMLRARIALGKILDKMRKEET